MDPFGFQQTGYTQQPIFYQQPTPFFPIATPSANPGGGLDMLSLMGSRTASGAAVASVLWNANGGASVGYNSMRSMRYGNPSFMSGGFFGALKCSLVVGGLMSLVVNAIGLSNGQENFAMATSNVTGDVIASGIGGAVGAGAAMAGSAILAGFMAPGLLLTVCAGACGIAGIMLADAVLRQSQTFQDIQFKTYSLFS